MFITKRIVANSKEAPKIKKLYIESFPENERFSFSMMLTLPKDGSEKNLKAE